MANPPVNRRPGVDADIFQGQHVRGFDVPAGDQTIPPPEPCDLIVSNGKSQIDQSVSNLIFASRTDDIGQPIFVMAQGEDATAPIGTVNFHVGDDEDPNGLITASTSGSLYASYGTPGLWQVQSDNTTWIKISDDLGGESLAETLVIGNVTGGLSILLTNGDFLKGEDSSTGDGATANIAGGNATGALGDGGAVLLQGGTSASGTTGDININTPVASGTGGSGKFAWVTGESRLGGESGAIALVTGIAGDTGFPGSAGAITIAAGRTLSTGAGTFRGGNLSLSGGQGPALGEGGSVTISAGISSDGTPLSPTLPPVAGKGGDLAISAGNSSQALPGGAVAISAGTGGSAGATGGNVTLTPGNGGGGSAAGEVIADGVFRADNIKRGNGNPNGSVTGNEGDVYQRLDLGDGQLWLNLNGTTNGWSQMALSGDFINSFEQMNWGYLSRSGANNGGSLDGNVSGNGTFEGTRTVVDATGTIGYNESPAGPHFSLTAPAANDYAGVDQKTNATSVNPPFNLTQDNIITFRVRNANVAGLTFFGLSDQEVADHALAPAVPGGNLFGFAATGGGTTWDIVTGDGTFNSTISTGVTLATTSSDPEDRPFFFVIDTVGAVGGVGPVVFMIFDPDLVLLSTTTIVATLPTSTEPLGLVMSNKNLFGGSVFLQVTSASIVSDAGNVAQGGGNGSAGSLALNQVLLNGNETGAQDILVNHASGIVGVTDDNGGSGADLQITSGTTTLATNNSGLLALTSSFVSGSGAIDPGQSTGQVILSSGTQTNAASEGNTGAVSLFSGGHSGTDGSTGNVVIQTGAFSNAAAGTRVQGDVLIAPGSIFPNPATTTGLLHLKGGSSNISGVTGGTVAIQSGENSSAAGDTGRLSLGTFSVNLDGDSGDLDIETGLGGTNAGDSGDVTIVTGNAFAGDTGFVGIASGDSANGVAGDVFILVGDTTSGSGSPVFIEGGDTSDGAGSGGDIILIPGSGAAGDGAVIVNGKLTVTGIIDPPALVMSGSASAPAATATGEGMLWIDNTASPSTLIFTNDLGADTDISNGGGGVTSLGALTDVTLTAPASGEVLTFNGSDWVNLVGVGGSPLSTILALGNTTGNLPIVVEDSLGSRITSDGDLVLDPSVTPGDAVVVDGLRWPEADGSSGQVLTTNGLGQLSFQASGGSSGPSFGEAFTRMQWGSVQPIAGGTVKADGIFANVTVTSSGGPIVSGAEAEGTRIRVVTDTVGATSAGVIVEPTGGGGLGFRLSARPLASFKFDGPSVDTNVRFFVGLTDATTIAAQTGVPTPSQDYVGLQIYTDVSQTTFQFVTDDGGGTPTTVNTAVSALGEGFELVIDGTVLGDVTLTLYDNTGAQLSTTTFTSDLPGSGVSLGYQVAVTTIDSTAKTIGFYGGNAVTRADLLNTLSGGGGNQDLASVLGFGASTGGIPIQGDDNAGGGGFNLTFLGGNSTGGGGSGGNIIAIAGNPDPGGNAGAGDLTLGTGSGAGTGDGGSLQVILGDGGPAGGDGGDVQMVTGAGPGAATGGGGVFLFATGDGGGTGGPGGRFEVGCGSAQAGNDDGGEIVLKAGGGFGAGQGGDVLIEAGPGGTNGDGGTLTFIAGTGSGAGVDGSFVFTGDMSISGKLTVAGMIDPPGLLMTSSGAVPFTPTGTEGGVWVNNVGELVFTNTAGDLNLSTAIGGGMTWLDAILTAGYGFLGAGNSIGGPESYGVYGGSINIGTSTGPPAASVTQGQDSDGPFLNLAVAADPASEAFVGTTDLQLQRNQQFKARFKFQVTSPAHTDERIFIGFTDDPALTAPSQMLATDTPVAGRQYMGIAQDLAGFNLNFVARGSGGAMTSVFSVPTDALVHYLEIDVSDSSGDVTFTLYDADGVTVSGGGSATHTEPASFLVPDLALAIRPFTGIFTATGTTPRAIDFYDTTVVTRADVVDAVTGGAGPAVPVLSAVLALGNDTGGTPIQGTDNAAGSGGDLELNGGISTGGGGTGGSITLITGSPDPGGNGDGGTVGIISSPGAGTGDGGSFIFQGGEGGTTGSGGSFVAILGDGDGAGTGGEFFLGSGSGGTTGDGGNFRISLGISGNSGGNGGSFEVDTGSAGSGSGGDGGVFSIVTGDGDGSGSGGHLEIDLGDSGGSGGVPGTLLVNSGDAGTGSGSIGGEMELRCGEGDGGGRGGHFSLVGGDGGASGDGGPGFVVGGDAGATGDGGQIQLIGGDATDAANSGGSVVLTPGTSAAGTDGVIDMDGKINPAGAGVQYGAFTPGAGAGPFLVPFNAAFSTAPTSVIYSIESVGVVSSSITPGSVLTTSFTIATSAALGAADVIRWTAYL